jgi:ATP-dependent Lon protease
MGKVYNSVRFSLAILLAAELGAATAQGIFTCVDSGGRKITSDRPIAECKDRDQKELNSSGTVKRVVKPVMTAQEQREFEAKQKVEAEERARIDEERRKNRALLSRYPTQAAHDKERGQAIAQVNEVIKAAQKRIGELAEQRKKIDEELEFYKKDPKKIPASLRRQIEDNERSVTVQKQFIVDQDEEKKRANQRFDEELSRLRVLWTQAGAVVSGAAPATSAAKK